jgi:hypothetical protein
MVLIVNICSLGNRGAFGRSLEYLHRLYNYEQTFIVDREAGAGLDVLNDSGRRVTVVRALSELNSIAAHMTMTQITANKAVGVSNPRAVYIDLYEDCDMGDAPVYFLGSNTHGEYRGAESVGDVMSHHVVYNACYRGCVGLGGSLLRTLVEHGMHEAETLRRCFSQGGVRGVVVETVAVPVVADVDFRALHNVSRPAEVIARRLATEKRVSKCVSLEACFKSPDTKDQGLGELCALSLCAFSVMLFRVCLFLFFAVWLPGQVNHALRAWFLAVVIGCLAIAVLHMTVENLATRALNDRHNRTTRKVSAFVAATPGVVFRPLCSAAGLAGCLVSLCARPIGKMSAETAPKSE